MSGQKKKEKKSIIPPEGIGMKSEYKPSTPYSKDSEGNPKPQYIPTPLSKLEEQKEKDKLDIATGGELGVIGEESKGKVETMGMRESESEPREKVVLGEIGTSDSDKENEETRVVRRKRKIERKRVE